MNELKCLALGLESRVKKKKQNSTSFVDARDIFLVQNNRCIANGSV